MAAVSKDQKFELAALESLLDPHMAVASKTKENINRSGFSPEAKCEIFKALLHTKERLEEERKKMASPDEFEFIEFEEYERRVEKKYSSTRQLHQNPAELLLSEPPSEPTLILKEAVEEHLVAAQTSVEHVKKILGDCPPHIFEAIRDSIQPLLKVWRKILVEEGKVLTLSAEALAANKCFI